MRPLAARTGRISTSQTVAIDTKFKRLRAEGKDVLSLGAGEPELDTPEHAKLAAIESIRAGRTKYSQVTGLPELKEAVSRKFARDNGLAYSPSDIVISSGAKHAVFNALLALVEEGDEVLIPTPCWVTYPELVRFLGGKPILLPTDMASGFKLAPRDLEKAVTPKSKLLILNSPGNPTGAVYSEADLRSLSALVVKHDLYCLSDEIYEYIVYEGNRHVSIAALGPEYFRAHHHHQRHVQGLCHDGMAHRVYGSAPALAAAIGAIQSHGTHHPANASQYAALAALQADGSFPETMRVHLAECRALALRRLAGIPGLQVFAPQGAFYAFFNLEAYLGKTYRGKTMATSMDVCEYLLDAHLLATVPGSSFGLEGFMRISFANRLDTLDAALDRLEKGFKALVPA